MDDIIDKILRQLLDAIEKKYDKTPGYLVYDILKAAAEVFAELYVKQDKTDSLLDVDNLTGELLEKFVYQRKGIERNKKTYSIGRLLATGNGTIRIGDLFETRGGIQYRSTEEKVIVGSGLVSIEAVIAGSSGNVPAHQITQMPVTISGITSVTNPEPTHDGYDAESDDSLRERYYIAVRTPATSGNKYHYLQWAKSVPGVGDARVFPLARGANTVEVVIIDQVMQPASQTLVDRVQDFIDPGSTGLGDGEAPIGAFCYVLSAAGVDIDVSASIQKDSSYTDEQIIQNVSDSIANYLKEVAFKLDYVSYARIGEAILNSAGVEDYSDLLLNGGNTNVPVGEKQVAILGAVTLV